jgi:gluconate 2-dehydrogenase alpha chain
MATVMKKVDAVIVGFGWVGAIMAKELTEAGLNVVALERGPMRDTYPDGSYPQVIDELTYNIRRKLFQDLSKSTVTIRHNTSQTAVPYRQLAAFLPGTGVGGAGLHWSGRAFPRRSDRAAHAQPLRRALRQKLHSEGHDHPRLRRDLRRAGTLLRQGGESVRHLRHRLDQSKARRVAHERRQPLLRRTAPDDFPLPAQKNTYSAQLFEKAARDVGYHPYNLPSANTSDSYTNPYGAQMGPCNFCGFCSGYACYMYSKASPNVNISAGAAHGEALRAAHQRQRAEGQPDRRQIPRHRRELRRRAGPRDRTASRVW